MMTFKVCDHVDTMSTETSQSHVEEDYGDNETYKEVLEWFNDTNEKERYLAGALRSEAEGIMEVLEEDYVEPDSVIDMGSTQPQAADFTENSTYSDRFSNTQLVGQALSALAEMPENITQFDYWGDSNEKNDSTRYDMTSVDYEQLYDVVEAVTRVEDDDLEWPALREEDHRDFEP